MGNFALVVLFLLPTLFLNVLSQNQNIRFQVIRQWKYLNFTWPNPETLRTATLNGLYIPENNIIAGVKYFEDFYYLTLPRMRPGVPATLVRIPAMLNDKMNSTSPNLEPYPSWQMNNVDDCNNLQNVQNVEIDLKGQMWIIDGGRRDTLVDPVVKCQPKLLIFDIKNNRTTTVFNFPEDIASKDGSYLYDLVVDDTDGGYAYITEQGTRDPGIIVFSVKENRSWKIRHAKSMHADPSASQFFVNGISVSAPINIAGIALGPKVHTSNEKVVVNEEREVYFSPLSSLYLYSINTTVLKNENKTKTDQNYDKEIKDVGLKSSQTAGMIMDNQGILYYGLLSENAIGKWDSHTSFGSNQKVIAKDEKYVEWPNSFAFDQSGNLTVIMNRLNKFIFDKLDRREANFRLISAHVGSKSYLYDNLRYDSEGRVLPEPESKPEPAPEPSPEPKPEPASKAPQNPNSPPEPHRDTTHNGHEDHSEPTVKDSVPPSSASSFALSVLCFYVMSLVLFSV